MYNLFIIGKEIMACEAQNHKIERAIFTDSPFGK